MFKLPLFLLTSSTLLVTLLGCGDSTLEVKTKSNAPNPTIVVEKPANPVVIIDKSKDEPSREVIKTESKVTPDGTTRTKETKTTTP